MNSICNSVPHYEIFLASQYFPPLLDSDVPHSIPFSDIRFNISTVVADKITVLVWATAPHSGYMFQHSVSTAPNSFMFLTEAVGSFEMLKHGPTM